MDGKMTNSGSSDAPLLITQLTFPISDGGTITAHLSKLEPLASPLRAPQHTPGQKSEKCHFITTSSLSIPSSLVQRPCPQCRPHYPSRGLRFQLPKPVCLPSDSHTCQKHSMWPPEFFFQANLILLPHLQSTASPHFPDKA